MGEEFGRMGRWSGAAVSDIAARIDAHLARMAASDPSFAGACANWRGDAVELTYGASETHYWQLQRETAEAYLSWLDAGNKGTVGDMEDA